MLVFDWFFFFKQKTAYELRISDWSSDVCSSDLDQLLVLERPSNGSADVFMRIRNHDGGEVGACGNGTRCVAALVMGELGRDAITIEIGKAACRERVCQSV